MLSSIALGQKMNPESPPAKAANIPKRPVVAKPQARSSKRDPWTSLTEVRANTRTVLFVRDRLLLAYAPAESFVTSTERDAVVAFSRMKIVAARATAGIASSELTNAD